MHDRVFIPTRQEASPRVVRAKREDWDDAPPAATSREKIDLFRQDRIASDLGQNVIEWLANQPE